MTSAMALACEQDPYCERRAKQAVSEHTTD